MNGEELVLRMLEELGPDEVIIDEPVAHPRREVKKRDCGCGSGEPAVWELDQYKVPLFLVCPQCREEKLAAWHDSADAHYRFPDDAELPTEEVDVVPAP